MFGYAVGIGPASARLASLSEHAVLVRLSVTLAVTSLVSALVLAVALFALTRHYDLELAVLALCARAAEAVIGAIYVLPPLAMLAIAASCVDEIERGVDSTEREQNEVRHRETLQFIRWRAATIWRTMRRLALRNDAVESRAGGRRERLAGGA
jgi:hypothetical protein